MPNLYVAMKTWLRLFPVLDPAGSAGPGGTGWRCPCGRPGLGWQPYIDKDFAGIKAEPCPCGRPGGIRATPRNKELNDQWVEMLGLPPDSPPKPPKPPALPSPNRRRRHG